MSTELMTAKNSTGSISITGIHRDNKRRYQITVLGKVVHDYPDAGALKESRRYSVSGEFEAAYVEVDAETIANMQRCVDKYRELCEVYPDSRD